MMGNLVKTACVLDNAENRMSHAIRWVGAALVAISADQQRIDASRNGRSPKRQWSDRRHGQPDHDAARSCRRAISALPHSGRLCRRANRPRRIDHCQSPCLDCDAAKQCGARWISTGPNGAGEGGTALYAIDFTLAQPAASATLDLRFSVDNALGGNGPNQGVYINGTAVSGNSTAAGFTSELTIARSDIAPLLVAGTNTLYINSTDQGGPGGLIFSATIETVPIPEPGTLALLGFGSLGLLITVQRLLRRHE